MSVVVVTFPALARVTVPALRPAVSALAVPPEVVTVLRVAVPVVDVTETLPPAPLANPDVLIAPELTVVPDSVSIQPSRRRLYRLRRRFLSLWPLLSRNRCRVLETTPASPPV